jgi:hypothetical protein
VEKGLGEYFTDFVVACPTGKVVLGGGFNGGNDTHGEDRVIDSAPALNEKGGQPTGWRVRAETSNEYGGLSVTAYALCGNAS